MNRAVRWVLIAALASCLPFSQAALANDVNFLYGQYSLGEDFFDTAGVDSQSRLGVAVTLDFDWPVSLALDLLSSSDDNTDRFVLGPDSWLAYTTEVDTMELDVGVRKLWDGRIQPYVGGGLAWITLDVKQTERGVIDPGGEFSDTFLNDDDSGIGFWLDAGLLYRVGQNFNIGLDVRYSDAGSMSLRGDAGSLDLDSGGTCYGIVLGYHW